MNVFFISLPRLRYHLCSALRAGSADLDTRIQRKVVAINLGGKTYISQGVDNSIYHSCAYSGSNKKRPHETATGHREECESNHAIRWFKNNAAFLVHSSIRWRESIVYKCFDLFSSL